MLERVRAALVEKELAQPGEALWVAVSGGVDSMVLLHALRQQGHPCHVAHVDHGLRDEASDADRELVRAYCAQHHIPCEVKRVDVKARATKTGESTQMAARALRLEWLNELAQGGPHKVATAHHADDAVETFFLGLMQGMGAKGWGSIPARNGHFIRPLLDIVKADIITYARENDIPWREDASNADQHYVRNRVRHELLPMLEQIRPGARHALGRNIALFREFDALGRLAGERALDGLAAEADGTLRIAFDRILDPSPLVILYHLLRDKGFHPDRLEAMLSAIRRGHTGARFPGDGVEVFIDRAHLVISPKKELIGTFIIPSVESLSAHTPISMEWSAFQEMDAEADARAAWLDMDRITFPLVLRPWRAGDRMRPDGLGGSKLISDILIDAKVPRDRKDRIPVLADAERIIWLCGMRLSEGVKATASSDRVVKITWSGS